jgi:hypothetical protein
MPIVHPVRVSDGGPYFLAFALLIRCFGIFAGLGNCESFLFFFFFCLAYLVQGDVPTYVVRTYRILVLYRLTPRPILWIWI